VKLRVGTSGWAFKEWRGPFYPTDLKDDAMLGYYAGRYPTVEINNTFYRLPREHVLADWASRVPDGFSFTIKASRSITHFFRLKPESKRGLDILLRGTAVLGDKLGPILFQLPPRMPRDVELLRAFVAQLPDDRRFTVEFRDERWFDDEVYAVLGSRDIALCVSETDDYRSPVIATASWGYVRPHKRYYDDTGLAEWRRRVAAQPWSEAYMFFKHDHADGSGPLAVDAFTQAALV
jgi:uncharacterized protein YecE (DUF72 family)